MEGVLIMKIFMVILLLISFIGCGTLAFAGDSTGDCNCKTGGLGLKISNFVCGFGFKTFSSQTGCDKNVGIGIGLGSELHRIQFGFGFDEGVFGIGIGFKGPETTTSMGFSIGINYGDCRMVWPIEE
jgi:hypothetical protein